MACIAGTGCYRFNDGYSECRATCPATWACETDYVGALEQCGGKIFSSKRGTILLKTLFLLFLGDDYTGITRCANGLTCYVRNQWYAHCAASCPGAGWVC